MRIAVAATGTLEEILAENVSPAGLAANVAVDSLNAACAATDCETVVPVCSPRALNRLTVTVPIDVPGFRMTSSVLVFWSSRMTGTTCVASGDADSEPSSVVVKSPEK